MRGNKDSFNFLEPLNRQSLSICSYPLTTLEPLNLNDLAHQQKSHALKHNGLRNPHRHFDNSAGSVVCGE